MTVSDSTAGNDPTLTEVSMHLVKPNDPVVGRVVANDLCMRGKSASFVRHVAIDVSGTPLEGGFKSGQSFGVIPPGTDAKGRSFKVRLYSIASPTCGEDGEGKVLATSCKRLIDEYQPALKAGDGVNHGGMFHGRCSNHLCDREVGDEVLVTGPAGKRFVLPQDPDQHDYVFFATGTGIAPFRGMVKDLFDGPGGATTSDVHLVMGVPYSSDLLYDDYFRELDKKHKNFHYHVVISREILAEEDRLHRGYVHHYLDKQVQLHQDMLPRDRTLVYMCGLAGMQTGVFQCMARLGIGDGFLKVKEDLQGVDPAEWDASMIKRSVRPTHRCMLEVY